MNTTKSEIGGLNVQDAAALLGNVGNMNTLQPETITANVTNTNVTVSTDEIQKLPQMNINIEKEKLTNPYNYNYIDHPNHYNNYDIEVIDMMERIWGTEKIIDWCNITAFKYRMRMGTKPNESVEKDLNKEQWYLAKAAELKKKLEK